MTTGREEHRASARARGRTRTSVKESVWEWEGREDADVKCSKKCAQKVDYDGVD
jgi:hypothetical protein